MLPLAGIVAATIFGQVTVNETMTARYISPALRAKMYSIRFFVGFLGAAAAAPLVGFLHERTGSLDGGDRGARRLRARDARLRAVLPGPAGGAQARAVERRAGTGGVAP